MKPDLNNVYALCEYCGHGVLLPESVRRKLREQQEAAAQAEEEEPPTQTERFRRQIEEEKKNRPQEESASDAADAALGHVLLNLFGLPFRIRHLISFLLMLASAVISFLLANRWFTDELRGFYMIAGVAATAVGALGMWLSYRVYKGVPLGGGLGILLSLLSQTLR